MPLKCVETIYQPSQVDEEIVHPRRKLQDKVHNQYYHRHGYRLQPDNLAAQDNRGSRHSYRGCEGNRWRQIVLPGPIQGYKEGISGVTLC